MIQSIDDRYIKYILIKTFLIFPDSVFIYTHKGMKKMVPSCANHNHGKEQTWHMPAQNILSILMQREGYCIKSNKNCFNYNCINCVFDQFYSPTLRYIQIDCINYRQYHFLSNHDHSHVYHLMQFVE